MGLRDLVGSLAASHRQYAEGMVKTQEDVARYRYILGRVHPRLIVELGSYSGKSARWFAQTGNCKVMTVDIDPSNVDEDTRRTAELAGVSFLVGRSTSSDIVSRIRHEALRLGGPTLVVADGDHSSDTVYEELLQYSPLVTLDSYMVVEDGIVRFMPDQMKPVGPYRGNPLDAIERFVENHGDCWECDMHVEDMFPTTQFPGGFLRRIG
jgi:cephalosporin hydroxylase